MLVDPRHTKIRRHDLAGYTPESPALVDVEDDNRQLSKLFAETIIWHDSSLVHSKGLEGPSWRDAGVPWSHRSALFDVIIEYFNDSSISRPTYSGPFSATAYIRNLVRFAWEEHVWRRNSILQDIVSDEKLRQGLASAEKKVEEYQTWMLEATFFKNLRRQVQEIMLAFNCADHTYRKHRLEPLRGTEDQGTVFALDALRREARDWAHLKDKIEQAEQDIRDHMEMYSQRAALSQTVEAARQTDEANALTKHGLEQANAANRMARSSSQLTKIVTVIVPCSFVASVFSMGGEFAAGQSLFFVYWVCSMPVTFTLLLWVIYGNHVTEAWEDSKRKLSKPGFPASKWAILRDVVSTWTTRAARRSAQVLGIGAQDEGSGHEKTGSVEV